MTKPAAVYTFTVLDTEEEQKVREILAAQSWETALLDGKMLRFDRRPRFSQAFRHRMGEQNLQTRSLVRSEGTYLWLEEPTPA